MNGESSSMCIAFSILTLGYILSVGSQAGFYPGLAIGKAFHNPGRDPTQDWQDPGWDPTRGIP